MNRDPVEIIVNVLASASVLILLGVMLGVAFTGQPLLGGGQ